jgi:hypothetical protein
VSLYPEWPDSVFSIARAMARSEGHDPDMSIVPMGGRYPGPYRVRGSECAYGAALPLWHLYAPLAQVAVDEMTKKIKG